MQEVRRLRQERGWSQAELAFYAKLAPSVISEIETGKRDPSASTLRKLANGLDVSVPALFEEPEALKAEPPLPFPAEERPAGGWPAGGWSPDIGWEKWIKLATAGLWIGVLEAQAALVEKMVARGAYSLEEALALENSVVELYGAYGLTGMRRVIREWAGITPEQRERLKRAENRIREAESTAREAYTARREQARLEAELESDKIRSLDEARQERDARYANTDPNIHAAGNG